MTRQQLKALAAHDIEGKTDAQIGAEWGIGRTAVAARRRRAMASLTPEQRRIYLERFPPRRGRPGKHRRNGK
jgi:DNA-directed RNA polymerase specialized sigma24 family protein